MTEKRKKPSGENQSHKLRVLRRGASGATSKYTIGGKLKTGAYAPRPITLATVKFTEPAE